MIERKTAPTILFVNSPQTSKDENLPRTNLLRVKKYFEVVKAIVNIKDRATLKEAVELGCKLVKQIV